MKIECDENTRQLPMFRFTDGVGVRRFTMVSENTYLTTARRLTLTFIWVHALGSGALMLPPPLSHTSFVGIVFTADDNIGVSRTAQLQCVGMESFTG